MTATEPRISLTRELILLLVDTAWPRCVLCGRRKGNGHTGHQVAR